MHIAAVTASGLLLLQRVKVLLLVCYVLGSFALKRGRTRAVRTACWIAALLVYLFIVGIRRTHHRLGIIALLMR